MKKIEAIFKPFKFHEIKAALAKERIQRFSLFEINGTGFIKLAPNNIVALRIPKTQMKSAWHCS
jgi:nitrogen regulatory protein PII